MIELNPNSTTYAMILNAQTGKADFTCILAGQILTCGQPCAIHSEDHEAVLNCVYSSYETSESGGLHFQVEGTKKSEADIRTAIQNAVNITVEGEF